MADQFMLKAVLSANAAGMLGTLKSVNQATKTTRKYLLDVGKSATNLAGQVGLPLGLIGGALSAFSIAGVQSAIAGFAELTGQISDSAKGLGLSAEEYQRIIYIANQSGVAADAMGASMGRLNKNIAMAVAGKNKEFASLMAKAGISMRNTNGSIKSATELLPELADLFQRNQNAGTQARMGNVALGKSWQALAALLNDGKKGIDDLTERHKMLGITIKDEVVAEGEKFGDQLTDLKLAVNSYGTVISAKLLPLMSPLIEKTIQWVVQNRELITTNVSAFITDMATSLQQVDWKGVVDGVRDFVNGCKDLIDWLGGTKNALIGLVLFMNIKTIAAFADLLGSTVRLGAGLIRFAIKAVPKMLGALGLLTTETGAAALATDGLTASTKAADAAASGLNKRLKTVLGTLGSIAIAAAPLAAMWGLKEWAGDPNDPETNIKSGERANWMQENLVNPTKGMLSWFGFDKDAGIEARRSLNRAELGGDAYPSLFDRAQSQQAGGKFTFEFVNAPEGLRLVGAPANSKHEINLDGGYSSFALGMP